MIPGALEWRVSRPAVRADDRHGDPHPVVLGDRERLQYELEGGGASRERSSGRRNALLARLWQAVMRGAWPGREGNVAVENVGVVKQTAYR